LGTWKKVGSYTGNVNTLFEFGIKLPILGSATLKLEIVNGVLYAVFSLVGQVISIPLLTL
jgi:hypothetical protein